MGQSQISIDILRANVFLAGWDDIYIYTVTRLPPDFLEGFPLPARPFKHTESNSFTVNIR